MVKRRVCLFFGGLTFAAVAATPLPNSAVTLTLAVGDQQHLGIATQRLIERRERVFLTGLAKVVDIGPLAALEAEIESARAAAETASAEVARRVRLAAADQSASRQAVEAAKAQAVADRARLQLAERRLALEWGTGIAQLRVTRRAQLIDDIANGKAVLLRIDAMDTNNIPVTTAGSVRIRSALPDYATLDGDSLGLTATADPRLQTMGIFVLIRSQPVNHLQAGRMFSVEMEIGPVETGVVLPASALVRLDGATWVYLRVGVSEFVRSAVVGARPVPDGWFVTMGFKPGEDIVVHGAGSALAVERNTDAASGMD